MTERARALAAAALALGLLAVPARAQDAATPYLQAAEETAAWLTAVTVGGTTWPREVAPDGTLLAGNRIGLDGGAAGIGSFFLALHAWTDDPQHLGMAVAAAETERGFHLDGVFNGPDYLGGAAGSGLFFLAMHAHTGELRYLQWARDAASWLEQTANRPAPGQAWWWHYENHPNHYTGVPHGAAGVALFQLALYLRTGEPNWLEDAEDAYRWVRTHTLPLGGDALGFKRKVSDDDLYNWWSGGSAGMLLLQAQLWGTTGNPAYLEDLRRTADGLRVLADPAAPAGVYWTTGSQPSDYRPMVFSHGNASIAPALLLAHELLGDPAYLATAQDSLRWIAAVGQEGAGVGADGVFWTHHANDDLRPSSAFTGSASVGWMLARANALAGDPALRALALRSADYLLAIAEHPAPGQSRWLSYPGPERTDFDTQGYELGWYGGAAGIGLFLLAAHELVQDGRPSLEVHVQ